jgi:hypothetical protein
MGKMMITSRLGYYLLMVSVLVGLVDAGCASRQNSTVANNTVIAAPKPVVPTIQAAARSANIPSGQMSAFQAQMASENAMYAAQAAQRNKTQ